MVAQRVPEFVGEVVDLERLNAERAERRLEAFVRDAWHVVEPSAEFRPNWHIGAVCAHLEAIERGEIKNLLVTMPPRMMKSLAISVFYPAWCWVRKPAVRFLYASYSQQLATDHSVATRRVIESDWYQHWWGDRFALAGDANLKTRFENDKRGARISTSVGGIVTGTGGDRLVCDDPLNAQDAHREGFRKTAIDWWDRAMATRLNDPRTGARIVVMQRLHESDLAGHIIDRGGYVHLNLPMEYEPDAVTWTGFGTPDPRTEPGQLLAPDRVGTDEVAQFKLDLGAMAYAGQYQQRPAPAEGAILKREWWRPFRPAETPPFDWVIQSWDTAFKTGQANDWSACVTIGLAGSGFYLLDCWRDRVEFPRLERAVRDQAARWTPDEIVVEDAASGQSLIQQLRRDVVWEGVADPGPTLPIVAFRPDRDKVARVNAVSPYLEGGRVFVPTDAPWVDGLVEEAASFPFGAHDDRVDALTMGLLRIAARLGTLRPLDDATLAYFDDLPGGFG